MTITGGRTVRFEVTGKVEGQPRPRMMRSGHAYSPMCAWRKLVAQAWRDSRANGFGDAPVIVEIKTHRRSTKRSGRKPEVDVFKPDIDNILKAALDGLVDAGAIDDDRQVIAVSIAKHPRTHMEDDEEEWTEIAISEWVTALEDE